jgi:proton-dependent oligopeptide transporter, POT family
MSQAPQDPTPRSPWREMIEPFANLFKVSRAMWGVNLAYFLEGFAYFGMLGLLAMYFNEYAGLNDIQADQMVGVLTAGVTLTMLVLGATVDLVGVRKSLLVAMAMMLIGRVLVAWAPDLLPGAGMWTGTHLLAMFGIVWIMLGSGIFQPAAYTAVKRFTTPEESAIGYAMLYALMNLGAFLPGIISPPVRRAFGITGIFWVYALVTLAAMGVIAWLITRRAMEEAEQRRRLAGVQPAEAAEEQPRRPLGEQVMYYIRNFPFRDARFMFFIFILIPVQTLFAHNWLTLPQYCERAFSGIVKDNFELFVNFNPLLIFILTPLVASYTARKNTYAMMIIGTLIMALSPFILVLGPHVVTLFAFLVVMTLGEAIWQPRFLQWVADIAPPDMTGIYMGLGQFPWFLTKVVTSIYAGWFLMNYCPADTPISGLQTEQMWLIYGGIALISPLALVLARSWMVAGFRDQRKD